MRATKATRAAVEERRAQYERDNDAREWARLEEEAKRNAGKPLTDCAPDYIARAHPDSYGAHIPLRPQGFRDMTRTTSEERATLAARPLMVTRTTTADDLVERRARAMMEAAGLDYWRDKARKELAETLRLHARAESRAAELSLTFA